MCRELELTLSRLVSSMLTLFIAYFFLSIKESRFVFMFSFLHVVPCALKACMYGVQNFSAMKVTKSPGINLLDPKVVSVSSFLMEWITSFSLCSGPKPIRKPTLARM